MQPTQTRGLVLRAAPAGENDRLVTVLTEDAGVLRAFARNSRRAKSRLVSATQPFCYARMWILARRSGSYLITEAQPLEVFFELREDLGRLALAQYFCEVAQTLAPPGESAAQFLNLLRGTLKLLCRDPQRPLPIVKAAFEMRMLSMAGYMPDLIGCVQCRRYAAETMYFYPQEGHLLCRACREAARNSGGIGLHPGGLTALRHTVYADLPKLFAFTLGESGQKELARASEAYLLAQLERGFQTLHFYHEVSNCPD